MLPSNRLGLGAAAAAAALFLGTQAAAHAKLVSSDPAAGATVAAPKTITLTFTEKLAPAFSTFELVMVDHNVKTPVKTTLSQDGKSIVGAPQGGLMAGAYKVIWSAASADGHRMTGDVSFKVK